MLDSFYRAFVAEQRYLLYLDGLKVTILVSVIAILIGVALGTILALMRLTAEQKGKSTLSAGVSYTRLLTGTDEENITGRFKGENATDFDILVAHKNEHSIGLNAKYTLELESGILFDVKGSYSLERDSHNGTGKNRAKGEWIVGTGLGYKF